MTDSITPKLFRKFGLKKEGSGYIKDMLVFSFNYSILLGCFNLRSLVNDAFRSIKFSERELRAII